MQKETESELTKSFLWFVGNTLRLQFDICFFEADNSGSDSGFFPVLNQNSERAYRCRQKVRPDRGGVGHILQKVESDVRD